MKETGAQAQLLDVTPEQEARLYRDASLQAAGTPRNESIQAIVEVARELDQKHIESAAEALGYVHDGLRMEFGRRRDGSFYQRLSGKTPVAVPPSSLREVAAGVCGYLADASLGLVRQAEAYPLVVAVDVDSSRDVTRLTFEVDHMVADAVSMDILLNDFGLLYEASKADVRDQVVHDLRARPGVSYLDHLSAQTVARSNGTLDRELAHWEGVIDVRGPLGAVDLDFLRHVPGRGLSDSESATARVGAPEMRQLRRFARMRRVTVNCVIFATLFRVFSKRVVGGGDLSLVIANARRDVPSSERVVGWLSTLALLPGPTGDAGASSVLDATWSGLLDLMDNQTVSFHEVKRSLRPQDYGKARDYPWIFVSVVDARKITFGGVEMVRKRSAPTRAFPGVSIGVLVGEDSCEISMMARRCDMLIPGALDELAREVAEVLEKAFTL